MGDTENIKISDLFTSLSVGFSLAKLLRNFCGTERKILSPLRKIFARNNSTLRNFAQKSFFYIVSSKYIKMVHSPNSHKIF